MFRVSTAIALVPQLQYLLRSFILYSTNSEKILTEEDPQRDFIDIFSCHGLEMDSAAIVRTKYIADRAL